MDDWGFVACGASYEWFSTSTNIGMVVWGMYMGVAKVVLYLKNLYFDFY